MQFIRLTTMLGAAAFILASVTAPAIAQAAEADVAKIKALEARFGQAFAAKDLDGIMKIYVPDDSLFVFDVIPPRQYVGYKAYRKDWQDFLATFQGPVQFTMEDLAVTADGSVGYGHSIQHVMGKGTDGKPVDFTVRVTDVYRKVKGQWLIVQEHVSVPVDVMTGKPDFDSKP